MRTRDFVVEYQKTLDDSGTLIKDLDIVDPVSALYLEFEGTNGSTSNKGNFLSDVITKVELVDGSEVLYSLNLSQLEALHFYKTGKTPILFPSEWAGGGQRHGCYLLFGRYLWDQVFGMNFKAFRNPQLKITSNIAAIRAASATDGFTTGSLKATIIAKIMEDAPIPSRYLMAKEINSFTSVTSGEKRIDLPVDYIYRLLLNRLWVQGEDIVDIITNLKLTCDSDKFIILNRKVRQLDAEALALFGRSVLKHDFFESHQDKVRLLHNMEPDCRPHYQSLTIPRIIGIDYQWSSEAKFNIFDTTPSGDTTDRKYTMVESGHALHATLPIPFGIMDREETWFDPKPYKKVEWVGTQGKAAACEICLEQVRPL